MKTSFEGAVRVLGPRILAGCTGAMSSRVRTQCPEKAQFKPSPKAWVGVGQRSGGERVSQVERVAYTKVLGHENVD